MAKQTKDAPARLIAYAPEVEARREKYTAIGAHLRDLLSNSWNEVTDLLDIKPPGVLTDEHEPHILYNAVEAHLDALFEDLARNYGDDFWTVLYPELRLYYDQCRLKHPGPPPVQKGGAE